MMRELENHLVVGNTDRDLLAFYGEWPEDENGGPLPECCFHEGSCMNCGRCEPEYRRDG
jgi:hypothetical protein